MVRKKLTVSSVGKVINHMNLCASQGVISDMLVLLGCLHMEHDDTENW